MRVGRVTERIHRLDKGEVVGVRGPFGQGYPLADFKDQEVLVVGGGCGFAPLRSLMYELFRRSGEFKKLLFRGGCKTPRDFLYRREIEGWGDRGDLDMVLTVDQGNGDWKGRVGMVTTILDNLAMDISRGIAVVCGPPVMMKYATRKLLELGFPYDRLYLSMEKNMSCGIGKCGHCRIGAIMPARTDRCSGTTDQRRTQPVGLKERLMSTSASAVHRGELNLEPRRGSDLRLFVDLDLLRDGTRPAVRYAAAIIIIPTTTGYFRWPSWPPTRWFAAAARSRTAWLPVPSRPWSSKKKRTGC
jgi:NAD(P)H-flavin reductase